MHLNHIPRQQQRQLHSTSKHNTKAVQHEWGGSESASKAQDLRTNILTYFDGSSPNPRMSQDELEDNLVTYLEEEFGVVLEDNSEREIADLIWRMYAECARGECGLVRMVVENAVRAEEKMSGVKSVIQSEGGMDESSDEDDDEKEGGDDGMDGGGEGAMEEEEEKPQSTSLQSSASGITPMSYEAYASGMLFGSQQPTKPEKDLPPPRQLGEKEPEKSQPEVDDDGFAAVPTKRRGKR
jgi:pre-rRNA-processing protein TSR2